MLSDSGKSVPPDDTVTVCSEPPGSRSSFVHESSSYSHFMEDNWIQRHEATRLWSPDGADARARSLSSSVPTPSTEFKF